MPFRARGMWVQKFKNGKWSNWRKAKSAARAKMQAAAININMEKSDGG